MIIDICSTAWYLKIMPRKPRIHFFGAFYHVIARGNRRQKIFLDNKDYQLYISFLNEYKDRYGFSLYAYTLMPNHVHLLIEVFETPLSKLMQNLQFRYTRNFNIKYKKRGHLFQGRYKAILCEKDSYFLELSAYIHLNPVRAGLVEDPINYLWSSYRLCVTEDKNDLVDRDFLWAQFSNKRIIAKKNYERFVMSRIGQGHRKDFYELKDQRFLGEEEFVEDVHRSLSEELPFVYHISIDEIVSNVSSVLNIPPESFYSPTRNRQGAWARAIVAYIGGKLGGHQVKMVAEHFKRDPAVISRGIRKVEKKRRDEKAFDSRVSKLEEAIKENKKRKIVN